jgi:hypothetical protein
LRLPLSFLEPLLGDPHQLRIAPDFEITVFVAKLLVQAQASDVKNDGLEPQTFRILAQIEGESSGRDGRSLNKCKDHAII